MISLCRNTLSCQLYNWVINSIGEWEIAALLQAFGCAVGFVRPRKSAAMCDSQNGFAEKCAEA